MFKLEKYEEFESRFVRDLIRLTKVHHLTQKATDDIFSLFREASKNASVEMEKDGTKLLSSNPEKFLELAVNRNYLCKSKSFNLKCYQVFF